MTSNRILQAGLAGAAALALCAGPQAASAQTAPPAPAPATVAAEAAPVDPARLAAARITIDHIFPSGTYARILSGPLDKMMDSMLGNIGQMPLGNLAAMGGASPDQVAKMPKGTLEEIMAIYDPAYHQRMTTATHAMMNEMLVLMNQVEPDIRDGLAHAYAGRFTLDQLTEMNRFFATPTGDAYASNALVIQMDPQVMAKMQGFMPLLMKAMPDMVKKVEAAVAALPKPRQLSDMTPAERARLAKLLGVSAASLDKEAARQKK